MNLVREALMSDIPRMREIRASVRENVLLDESRVTEGDYLWYIANGPVWVYERDGDIKGLAAGHPETGVVWALFVDPAYEGQGIGQALFARVCQSLKDKGIRDATLYTEPGTRAERFYHADGWVRGAVSRGEVRFTKCLTL